MTWDEWLDKCNKLAATMADGRMTDDFEYDWLGAWEWGDDPGSAVLAAIIRNGVHSVDDVVQ